MMAIHGGRGISVYPSVQSLLSVWRRRIRTIDSSAPLSWKVEGLDFDPILKGDLVRGSTVLLSGPPKTHRLLLGLSFLAAELEERPDSHTVIVSLREDPASLYRIISNHPQLRALLEAGKREELSSRLKVLHVPPDYFSAERFIHWLRNLLREFEQRNEEVGRILFSSVHQLLHNSPMLKKEKLFLDGLLEFCKRKHITSMFLSSESEREKEIRNAFDVLLFTGKRVEDGEERVTFQVGHSGPCNADHRIHYLDRVVHDGGAWLLLHESSR
jgi:KaiC/GvpD/RAD55 family RecA-like ATPase